eukprot:2095230-Amphidinium_carterae.1
MSSNQTCWSIASIVEDKGNFDIVLVVTNKVLQVHGVPEAAEDGDLVRLEKLLNAGAPTQGNGFTSLPSSKFRQPKKKEIKITAK